MRDAGHPDAPPPDGTRPAPWLVPAVAVAALVVAGIDVRLLAVRDDAPAVEVAPPTATDTGSSADVADPRATDDEQSGSADAEGVAPTASEQSPAPTRTGQTGDAAQPDATAAPGAAAQSPTASGSDPEQSAPPAGDWGTTSRRTDATGQLSLELPDSWSTTESQRPRAATDTPGEAFPVLLSHPGDAGAVDVDDGPFRVPFIEITDERRAEREVVAQEVAGCTRLGPTQDFVMTSLIGVLDRFGDCRDGATALPGERWNMQLYDQRGGDGVVVVRAFVVDQRDRAALVAALESLAPI